MSISKKLILAFILAAVLIIVIGIGGILYLGRINTSLKNSPQSANIIKETSQLIGRARLFFFLAVILSSASVLTMGVFLTGRFTKPFRDVLEISQKLVSGDLSFKVSDNREDEWGQVNHAFKILAQRISQLSITSERRNELQQSIERLLLKLDMMAKGDLTVEAEITDDAIGKLAEVVNAILKRVSIGLKGIKGSTERVKTSSENVLASCTQSDEHMRTQEADITSLIQTLKDQEKNEEEITTELQRFQRNANEIKDITSGWEKAIDESLQGIQATRDESERILAVLSNIEEKVKGILVFSNTVSKITAKADLLALNASIEASRLRAPGSNTEYGVPAIAEEIRKLIESSKEASIKVSSNLVEFQKNISDLNLSTQEESKKYSIEKDRLQKLKTNFSDLIEQTHHISEKAKDITQSVRKRIDEIKGVRTRSEGLGQQLKEREEELGEILQECKNLKRLAVSIINTVETFRLG